MSGEDRGSEGPHQDEGERPKPAVRKRGRRTREDEKAAEEELKTREGERRTKEEEEVGPGGSSEVKHEDAPEVRKKDVETPKDKGGSKEKRRHEDHAGDSAKKKDAEVPKDKGAVKGKEKLEDHAGDSAKKKDVETPKDKGAVKEKERLEDHASDSAKKKDVETPKEKGSLKEKEKQEDHSGDSVKKVQEVSAEVKTGDNKPNEDEKKKDSEKHPEVKEVKEEKRKSILKNSSSKEKKEAEAEKVLTEKVDEKKPKDGKEKKGMEVKESPKKYKAPLLPPGETEKLKETKIQQKQGEEQMKNKEMEEPKEPDKNKEEEPKDTKGLKEPVEQKVEEKEKKEVEEAKKVVEQKEEQKHEKSEELKEPVKQEEEEEGKPKIITEPVEQKEEKKIDESKEPVKQKEEEKIQKKLEDPKESVKKSEEETKKENEEKKKSNLETKPRKPKRAPKPEPVQKVPEPVQSEPEPVTEEIVVKQTEKKAEWWRSWAYWGKRSKSADSKLVEEQETMKRSLTDESGLRRRFKEKVEDEDFWKNEVTKVALKAQSKGPITWRNFWKETKLQYRMFVLDNPEDAKKLRLLKNRCVIDLLTIMIYCGIGAFMFKFTEGAFESFYKCGVKRVKRDFIEELWRGSQYLREDEWKSKARRKLLDFENQLHEAFEAGMTTYSGQKSWSFLNSVIYCLTVVSTIGYGHIAPSTVTGRALTIVYAVFGIPMFLILLADFGKMFTRGIKWIWAFVRRLYYTGSCKKVRKTVPVQGVMKGVQVMYDMATFRRPSQSNQEGGGGGEADPGVTEDGGTPHSPASGEPPSTPAPSNFAIDDEFNLPITVAIVILVIYIMCGAAVFWFWEEDWTFFDAFYFVFISMSTIGFGDLVPKNKMYMMASIVYLAFGLALTTMCINVVQEKLSDTFRQATSKIGATIGLTISNEDGTMTPATPANVELAQVHKSSSQT